MTAVVHWPYIGPAIGGAVLLLSVAAGKVIKSCARRTPHPHADPGGHVRPPSGTPPYDWATEGVVDDAA